MVIGSGRHVDGYFSEIIPYMRPVFMTDATAPITNAYTTFYTHTISPALDACRFTAISAARFINNENRTCLCVTSLRHAFASFVCR
jgi:hypothetical protein